MKRLILFISIIFSVFISANGANETKLVKEVRDFYDGLDHSEMKTDYLFNRGFVILNKLKLWKEGNPIIVNFSEWKLMLDCIQKSKIKGSEYIIDSNEFNEGIKYGNTILLSALNFYGDYISDANIKKYKQNLAEIQYQRMNIFSGTVQNHILYSGNVAFEWLPEYYFSNQRSDFVKIEIDFSDNNGFREIDIKNRQQFNVNYQCIGEKSICFRLISKRDTLISYSHVDVKKLKEEPNFKSTNVSFSLNGGDYLYREGTDGKLDKPIIIAEGFDILDNMDKYYLESKWSSYISMLRNNGYDIFYLDFDNPGASLQDNANVVTDLIQNINNNKVGNYEGIYIGESMGGIIGRIALKNMENSNYDHQISLFVPFDSPFKGAYLPEGIQWTLFDLYENAGDLVLGSFIVSIFDELFNAEIPSMSFLMAQLNSTSAKQMLVRHYTGSSTHNTFETYLNNLGYPNNSRNVAIVNGSNNGTYQSSPTIPGDPMYSHNLILGIVNYSADAWYTNIDQDLVAKIGVYELLPLPHWSFSWYNVGAGNQLFTNAPGSYIGASYDAPGYSGDVKFTFVPTVSAIDISNSIFNVGDFDYFNNNENSIIVNGLTPFDDIYIDGDNTYHVWGDYNLFYNYIAPQEIMYSNMYLQNRILINDRDFEASQTITIGSNTQPWGSAKHQDTGDFIINSGTTVNMEAGQSIKLKSGFKLCSGANLKMSIDQTNPNTKSGLMEQLATPLIIGNKYVGLIDHFSVTKQFEDESISWRIIGNNYEYQSQTEEFLLPDDLKNGQYTLFVSVNANGQESSYSKVVIVNNISRAKLFNDNNINDKKGCLVYPNPTTSEINVEISKNIIRFRLEIRNVSGVTVLTKSGLNSGRLMIDISTLQNGIYFVELIVNNEVVSIQKLVKE